jgi:hypothetical protein
MNTAATPEAAEAGTAADNVLDRVARLVAPPLHTLGGAGTLVAPLGLVLALSMASVATIHGVVAAAPDAPMGEGMLWALGLLSPVTALFKGIFFGATAWALLVLLGASSPFRAVLSALLYGEVVLAFLNVWVAGVVLARGRFDPAEPVHAGLDAFVAGAHPVLLELARGVTPFHAAWLLFLTFALTTPAGAPRWKGAVVAGALWSLSAGLIVFRAALV